MTDSEIHRLLAIGYSRSDVPFTIRFAFAAF
jgi:hypothetical protein